MKVIGNCFVNHDSFEPNKEDRSSERINSLRFCGRQKVFTTHTQL